MNIGDAHHASVWVSEKAYNPEQLGDNTHR